MAPLPNSTQSSSSSSTATTEFSLWFQDVQSQPTKIILLTSVAFHFLLFTCLIYLFHKYRKLQNKFKIIKKFQTDLDTQKRETTKLNNFYNNTTSNNNNLNIRPGTNSASGIYFDDHLQDQKLLSNPPHAQKQPRTSRHHSSSSILTGTATTSPQQVQQAPGGDGSMPPTPLPRSKSKPEFQVTSNNNNLSKKGSSSEDPKSEETEITSGIFSESAKVEGTTPPAADDSATWFIPVTPATNRSKGPVQHTPHTNREKQHHPTTGPGPTAARQLNYVPSPEKSTCSSNSSNNSPMRKNNMNPLAGLTLWEQHENRPVLKHAK